MNHIRENFHQHLLFKLKLALLIESRTVVSIKRSIKMTIKRRFLISYIGGIAIACLSLLAILCIVLYVTTGEIPSPGDLYRTFTKQRSLSPEEGLAYIQLRNLAKKEPDQLLHPSSELLAEISEFEQQSLGIVIRENETITYYSQDLVEHSLVAHFPSFDADNLETRGTIDNAGRLYRYMKFDFYFSTQKRGSLLVLKNENSMLEFMTKWGIVIICAIVSLSITAVFFLNRLLKKTVIKPLETLGKEMSKIGSGHLGMQRPEQTKNLAVEVKQLINDFDEMRSALVLSTKQQNKLESNRKELVASISHDLKTPITAIIGYVEGLLDGVANSPEKQKKYLETIHLNAQALNNQIEELFLYSKLDADALPFHFELLELNDFLKHRIEEFHLQDSTLQIEMDTATKPVYIEADRLQLNRVLVNIIENSIKFADPERSLMIQLSIDINDDFWINLGISDNGQGIPNNQLPYVFDHFYRAEKERSTQTGGSGLGLAIVKQIIERHQGTVAIDSQYSKGTTVTIRLKRKKVKNL